MTVLQSPRSTALTLTALLLPLTVLAGSITGIYFKSNNPDNVDITNGLAYLQQTMTAGIATAIIISLIIAVLIVRMYRQDKNFVQAKLPLAVFVTVLVMIGAIGGLANYNSALEDQYRSDHGQPTLKEFFDKLDASKQ